MDNCIGKRNYKYFFFFVTSLTLFIVCGIAFGLLSIVLSRDDIEEVIVEYPSNHVHCIIEHIYVYNFVHTHAHTHTHTHTHVHTRTHTHTHTHSVYILFLTQYNSIILLVIGSLVFIPVVGLAGFHIGLVCKGRTTNEHVTGKFRGVNNPYDQGCTRNYLTIMCNGKFPR